MFITFEGGEGAGKSTQVKKTARYLEDIGYKVVSTREPGGTEIGRQIRRILKSTSNKDLDPVTELLLYLADRVQHLRQMINPALSSGRIVICDRYFDSTSAYQGIARKLEVSLSEKLHQMFEAPTPDLTFLLDLPVSLGLHRAQLQLDEGGRDKTQNRFEEEDFSFHEDLRQGYLALAKKEPNRFCVIDAKFTKEKVWQQIKNVLDSFF